VPDISGASERIEGMTQLQKILRRHEVEAITGKSRSSIYDDMARGLFPKPVRIGAGSGAVGWLESEIAEWQAARIAERDGKAA
jgi:prophage regulatory protein